MLFLVKGSIDAVVVEIWTRLDSCCPQDSLVDRAKSWTPDGTFSAAQEDRSLPLHHPSPSHSPLTLVLMSAQSYYQPPPGAPKGNNQQFQGGYPGQQQYGGEHQQQQGYYPPAPQQSYQPQGQGQYNPNQVRLPFLSLSLSLSERLIWFGFGSRPKAAAATVPGSTTPTDVRSATAAAEGRWRRSSRRVHGLVSLGCERLVGSSERAGTRKLIPDRVGCERC